MKSQKFMVVASRAYEVDCNTTEEARDMLMEDIIQDFPTECVDLKIIPYDDYGFLKGNEKNSTSLK